MNRMQKVIAGCTAILLAAGMAAFTAIPAAAEDAPPPEEIVEVVETPAVTEPEVVVEETPVVEEIEAPATFIAPSFAPLLVVADPVGVFGTIEPQISGSDGTNHESFWQDREAPHDAVCYKHNADDDGNSSNSHGSSNGYTVTLNPYGADWPGDHYEWLVVKAGNAWLNVIHHPSAGVAYGSPDNAAGNQAKVSHWIVCKGTTPPPEDVCPNIEGNQTEVPAGYNENCEPPVNEECEVYTDGGTATQLDANGWVPFDTRPKGHAEFVDDGLHIYTDDASSDAKLQWAKDVADFPLTHLGEVEIDYDATFGAGVGIKANVTFASGLSGTLIYESVYDVGGEQDFWLPESANAGIIAPDNGGGFGSTRHGTINEWLSAYPGAVVTAIQFGIGSGVYADGVLHSFVIGCAEYDFDKVDVPVTIQFSVEAPPALCGIDAELPDLGLVPEGVERLVERVGGGTGPGTYTITFTALPNFVIIGQAIFNIVVPEALLFQSENNEAPCYVEPRDDETEIVTETQKCGDTTVDVTTTTTSWVLDTETGELVEQEPVVTVREKSVTPTECPGLALTGAVTNPLVIGGGIAAILAGIALTLGLAWRRNHSVSAE